MIIVKQPSARAERQPLQVPCLRLRFMGYKVISPNRLKSLLGDGPFPEQDPHRCRHNVALVVVVLDTAGFERYHDVIALVGHSRHHDVSGTDLCTSARGATR